MLKSFLADMGLTASQAIMAIPILLSLSGILFKLLKAPFKMVDIISVNKYVSLPLKEKMDAISTIYQQDSLDKTASYIRELKLAEYGLHYPVGTLRIMFDYLHSLGHLSISARANDFLKNRRVFTIDENNLPQLSKNGMISILSMIFMFLILCSGGFIIGVKAVVDTLHSVPNWTSGIKLILFSMTEILFFVMIITMLSEANSVFKAVFFSKKLRKFNKEQLYKKYKN